MPFVSVTPAVLGEPASSVENNKIISNCIDLDTRTTSNTGIITHGTSGNAALNTRVTALESGGVVGLKRAVYPSQNTSLTGAVTTVETDIPKLQIINLSMTSGVLYRFNYVLNLQTTTHGDAFSIRLRRTNPLVGPLVGTAQYIAPSTGLATNRPSIAFYWVASSTSTFSFYVSLQRAAGAGSVTCYQDADFRNFVEAFHVGVPGGGVIETPA